MSLTVIHRCKEYLYNPKRQNLVREQGRNENVQTLPRIRYKLFLHIRKDKLKRDDNGVSDLPICLFEVQNWQTITSKAKSIFFGTPCGFLCRRW